MDLPTDREKFFPQNTELCTNSFRLFKEKLLESLFHTEVPGDSPEKIKWSHVYKTYQKFGIRASETTIWNVLLTPERIVQIQAEKKQSIGEKSSKMFEKEDFTEDVLRFLFQMTKSNKRRRKPVTTWKRDLCWAALTQKFIVGNACSFLNTLLILIVAIILITEGAFPIGEGIFDSSQLCKVVVGLYAFGCFWYFLSLLGEIWYPYIYGGLVVNLFFSIASSTFLVLFAHLVTPGYYEEHGCFECPTCTETGDALCFTYYSHIVSINHAYSEVNTCSCALKEELRISEPIIPYGKSEEYCGGDDCSCAIILSNSQENWIMDQEYYSCLYFSPKGQPLFVLFGYIKVLMTINIVVSLFSCLYLIMMCLGCGKKKKNICNCCGINFSDEQEEVSDLTQKSSAAQLVVITTTNL